MNCLTTRVLTVLGFVALTSLSLIHLGPRFSLVLMQQEEADVLVKTTTTTTNATEVKGDVAAHWRWKDRLNALRAKVSSKKPTPNVTSAETTSAAATATTGMPTTLTTPNSTEVKFYSLLRGDGLGSAIQDQLMAHAFALKHNLNYAGACEQWTKITEKHRQRKIATCQQHVDFIGLHEILPIACPANGTNSTNSTLNENEAWLDEEAYRSIPLDQLFTPEWRAFMEPLLRVSEAYQTQDQQQVDRKQSPSSSSLEVAVHIRRGDVSLCGDRMWQKRGMARYLPNSYYQQVIEHYVVNRHLENVNSNVKNATVTVYSQHRSTEPWDSFTIPSNNNNSHQNNNAVAATLDFQLDTSIEKTWRGMMTADVLILSRSSFSYVPAILNLNGRIIYHPYWNEPLPHWEIVDDAIFNATKASLKQLEKTKCGRNGRF